MTINYLTLYFFKKIYIMNSSENLLKIAIPYLNLFDRKQTGTD